MEEGLLSIKNVFSGVTRTIDDLALLTYATPRIPDDDMAGAIREAGVECLVVGDAYAPRTLLAATRQGYEVGKAL